jgi:hypothetical protein
MRTFVYDNYGCDLLRCMFACMNMDGRAQWLPKKLLEKYSKKRVY